MSGRNVSLVVLALVACGAAEARVPSADGVRIHYVAEGSGPAVVLAHCLGCNLHYWDVAAADLARDHRVIRLDYAGHGTSGSERTSWSIVSFANDIRAVVDAAGADRFTLVGHSMSGPVALEAARQLGDRVIGVVPVDTVVDADEHIPAETRAKVLAQVRHEYRDFVEAQFPLLMAKNPDPHVVARVRADALAKSPERTAAILDSLLQYREDLALDSLRIPIIAIDSDRRPLALEHNRAHAPQFDARVIPDTGHWLMFDRPEEFARTLREVVVTIESGRARRR